MFHLQDGILLTGGALMTPDLLQLLSNNHFHQIRLTDVPHHAGAADPAVPQHQIAVTDFLDLVQKVGDINNGLTLLPEPPDDTEEVLLLVQGEGGCGFVKDDNGGTGGQCPCDLHNLTLADRDVLHPGAGIDIGPQHIQQLCGFADGPFGIGKEGNGTSEQAGHKDIFRHCHGAEKDRLLMDKGNPCVFGLLGAGKGPRRAVNLDFALVAAEDAAQNVHQRRLAGAVDADQPQHLAVTGLQTHLVQRAHTRELLGDILHFQHSAPPYLVDSLERNTSIAITRTIMTPLTTIPI